MLEEARARLEALLMEPPPYTGDQLRTIAELHEIVYNREKARPWWERAAEVDEDAKDYLALLVEEDKDPAKAKADTDALMARLGIEEDDPATEEFHVVDGVKYLCRTDDHYCPEGSKGEQS